MLDFITYDFGYSWSVPYAMLAPLILAGSLAALPCGGPGRAGCSSLVLWPCGPRGRS